MIAGDPATHLGVAGGDPPPSAACRPRRRTPPSSRAARRRSGSRASSCATARADAWRRDGPRLARSPPSAASGARDAARRPGRARKSGTLSASSLAVRRATGISVRNAPVSRHRRSARLGHATCSIVLSSSCFTRSATAARGTARSPRCRVASRIDREIRSARRIGSRASARSRSSRIRASASPTARTTRRARSPRPSNGSRSSSRLGEYAIALIVKSRRARSSSSDAPNSTTAWRPSVFTSRRNVVTSCIVPDSVEHADGAELDADREWSVVYRRADAPRPGSPTSPGPSRGADGRGARRESRRPRTTLRIRRLRAAGDFEHGGRGVSGVIGRKEGSRAPVENSRPDGAIEGGLPLQLGRHECRYFGLSERLTHSEAVEPGLTQLEQVLATSSAAETFKRRRSQLLRDGGCRPYPRRGLRSAHQGAPRPHPSARRRARAAHRAHRGRARSGCSDFVGTVQVHTSSETRVYEFIWDCRWRAEQEGWTDCFGFPDQIRAAREYDWRCFVRWEPVAAPELGALPLHQFAAAPATPRPAPRASMTSIRACCGRRAPPKIAPRSASRRPPPA